MTYADHYSKRQTPQSEKAHADQAENNAGGYSFVLDDWSRLDRFLILGSEGGTYYVGERELTRSNAQCVERCLNADGARAVARIREISVSGRAPKNDAAIFALAIASAHDSADVRRLALAALPEVCRIGTHLFQYVAAVEKMRGWGRALRRAVGRWYTSMPEGKLAYQALKYQQRAGWSHRDVLRLAHAGTGLRTESVERQAILRWIVAGTDGLGERRVERKNGRDASYGAVSEHLPEMLAAYEQLKRAASPKEAAVLIEKHGFTREMVPTQFLKDVTVWDALFEKMPMTAMIRNLGKMSQVGLLAPMSDRAKQACERILDRDRLRNARVHPIAILMALGVYAEGAGVRGSLTWTPVSQIVDALDDAFYLAFDNIVPTGKNTLIGIDVSGSMSWASSLNITAAQGAAAMAMVAARTEPVHQIMGFASTFRDLGITANMRLKDVLCVTGRQSFGATDCALPMLWALQNKVPVDAFYVYTDNETWFGEIHPHQALERYRQKMGRDAKLVVVGMTATEFSIANPNDGGMLDVVGFDAGAPTVMADFVRGSDGKEALSG